MCVWVGGGGAWYFFCSVVLNVLSSFAFILLKKRVGCFASIEFLAVAISRLRSYKRVGYNMDVM